MEGLYIKNNGAVKVLIFIKIQQKNELLNKIKDAKVH